MVDLKTALVEARRSRGQIAWTPDFTLDDVTRSYEIQAAVASAIGARPAGWKVGRLKDGRPFAAPILNCDMYPDKAEIAAPAGEPIKAEAEFALRLGRDLPPRAAPYSRDDVVEAIAESIVGIELVRARFLSSPTPHATSVLADNFNNWGFVVGAASATFDLRTLDALHVHLTIDGVCIEDAIGSHQMGDPLRPVVDWANAQQDRFGGLRAGQVITTGTLTRPFSLSRSVLVDAHVVGLGTASCKLIFKPSREPKVV